MAVTDIPTRSNGDTITAAFFNTIKTEIIDSYGYGGYTSKTADYNIAITDYIIALSGSVGTVTATLPAASTFTGKSFVIYATNLDNQVDIATNASEEINGISDNYIFANVNDLIKITSDGSNWFLESYGSNIKNNLGATAAPTVDDDINLHYTVGSLWCDTTGDVFYICVDNTDGAAVWSSGGSSGSSGSGGINYITNYNFETDTTGWSAYADAAGVKPVDGEGGSPTLAISRITSGQLRGDGSGRITKDAADRQGEGIAYDFTLDNADLHSVMKIEFDCNTSANYADGDMRIYVISSNDTLGSDFNVIEPVATELNAGEYGTFTSFFQTDASDLSYRLCYHVASASTLAYTVDIDNVIVGPYSTQAATPITDWQSYTPVINGFGTPTNVDFRYRRVGDTIEVKGELTASSTSGVEAQFGLPSGLAIKTGLLIKPCGVWIRELSNASHGGVMLATGGDSFFNMSGVETFSSTAANPITPVNDSNLGTQSMSFFASTEVEGWGSTVPMSDVDAGQIVYARYNTSAAQAVGTAATDVVYGTVVEDTREVYNPSTGIFTAPCSGQFYIEGRIFTDTETWSAGHSVVLQITDESNNQISNTPTYLFAGDTKVSVVHSDTLDLNKGDQRKFRALSSVATNLDSSTAANILTIFKINSGRPIGMTETVAAKYETDSGQSIGNASETTAILDDVIYDTHGSYNTTTGKFTAPESCKIEVNGQFLFASTAITAGEIFYMRAAHYNSAAVLQKSKFIDRYVVEASNTYPVFLNGSMDFDMVKGDYIIILLYQNSGGAILLEANTNYNNVTFKKIGN